jgi:hypothetical protein
MGNTTIFDRDLPGQGGISMAFIVIAIFLSGVAIGILAILVAGIRGDDRARNLTGIPRTRTAAVTRRLLGVGVRDIGTGSENRDEHS